MTPTTARGGVYTVTGKEASYATAVPRKQFDVVG